MKTFTIHGEIHIADEMDLKDFCALFNRLQDENDFGFSGFIKDRESKTDIGCEE